VEHILALQTSKNTVLTDQLAACVIALLSSHCHPISGVSIKDAHDIQLQRAESRWDHGPI
jgi:hypothetical protein